MRTETHVRIPQDLHHSLYHEARRLGISINALIVIILREWEKAS
jgi:predicted HicB family RNase H-like nuclease